MPLPSLSSYLAVFRWFQIWSTKDWIFEYLQFAITGDRLPLHVLLLVCILLGQLFNSLYLYHFPLSLHQRMVHFDFGLVWFSGQRLNIGSIALTLSTIYLLLCAYHCILPQTNLRFVIFILSTVIYQKNDRPFLFGRIRTLWHKTRQPVCLVIEQFIKLYMRLVIKMPAFFISLMLALNSAQMVRFLWTDWHCLTYWEMVALVGCKLALDLEQTSTFRILAIFGYFIFTFTVLVFIQLNQATALIARKRLTSKSFERFRQHHTTTLVHILHFRPLFSYLIFGFSCTQLPTSSYFLSRIALGQVKSYAVDILIPIIAFQFAVIFGHYILAAFYTNTIHGCAKYLLRLNGRKFIRPQRGYQLAFHRQVVQYIEKMHTTRQYGIHIGNEEVVSLLSFGKFLFFYGQVIMITFQLIEPSYNIRH